MMSPSDEERIVAMVDSFTKTVARNFSRNLKRAKANAEKHYSDEPVDYLLETLSHDDRYPSDHFVLYADELSCVVHSETLYKALCSLPEKQRNGPVCLVRIGSFCMRRTFVCVAPNQHFDRCTHSKIFLKIFFKNFPVCTPEMCSGYVRRRKRTSSNLQKGGMRHDVSL